MIRHIVAIDSKRGIAKNGVQPWKLPDDERYFSNMTKKYGANILVGSTTYKLFKQPLPGRHNYVLTSHTEPLTGAVVVNNLEVFLKTFNEDLWIIGGATLYEQTLAVADELYVTQIEADFECDTFYPDFVQGFKLRSRSEPRSQNNLSYTYNLYVPKNYSELEKPQ
jgi:dihydrofolate reductase